jgi:twitching motility two-component system response regulator PilG
MNTKEEILAILLMRFKIQPSNSLPMVQSWFRKNQQENWETLKKMLKHNQITLSEGELKKVSQSTYKILCIDDSPIVLREINRLLEGYDGSVFLINNPINALREMIRIEPDLIMMDVNMPGIDGYQLCRLIRNHSLLKTKPVVMMTGNTGLIDRAKARMAGATDYLTKPFSRSEFLEILNKYVNSNFTNLTRG